MNIKNNNDEIAYIETRFGPVASAHVDKVFLENGLVGFAELKDFFLIKSLFQRFNEFVLLQLSKDASFSLILYPIEKEDIANYFDQQKLNEIITELGIRINQLSIYLVANVKIIEGKQKVFVNNKAPILLNRENYIATQYIINDKKYEIRREISL